MKNNQIIPTFTGELAGNTLTLVDARLLHEFLGVGRDFSTWIKGRISEYEFEEGTDFTLTKTGELESTGLQGKVDYYLSTGMAKELGMLERSEKGKQIRKYFISMEEKALTYLKSEALMFEDILTELVTDRVDAAQKLKQAEADSKFSAWQSHKLFLEIGTLKNSFRDTHAHIKNLQDELHKEREFTRTLLSRLKEAC